MIDTDSGTRGDLKPAGILAGLGLYAVAAPPLGLAVLLLASPVIEPLWADLMPVPAFVLAVGLGVALVGSALLPSIGFAAYVGYLCHGTPRAYAIVVLTILGATYLGLAWARSLSRDAAQRLLRSHPRGQRTLDAMERDSKRGLMGLVFLSRLSPHMPFALTNILVAQLHRSSSRLALVSTLGLLPRSVLAVAIGGGLSSVEGWSRASLPGAWAWLVTAVVLGCFARILFRAYRKVRR
jgi:uncharacterized membrane protein YdjX (TVP38/TMEM64 family)